VDVDFDFADVMERIQRVVQTIEPHDSVERYTSLGVDCHQGHATIRSPHEVEVNGKVLSTRNITIATGARPFVPAFPGIEAVEHYTSDSIWNIRKKPEHMVILGGGPIGSELAQAFNRLGVNVTQVEQGQRIMQREDPEISLMLMERFKEEGVEILTEHTVTALKNKDGKKVVVCDHKGQDKEITCDLILVAIGRKPNTTGFGLQELGVDLNPNGTVKVDDYLRTLKYKNIYACGDVAGPYQFTHTASHQAWYCAVNSMIKPFWGYKVDYRVIPWATYTDPEVARVGLNELEAKEKGIPYEVSTYGIDDLDRAIADEAAYGVVKVLTVPGRDTILGVTIAGVHAGDLIAEYVAAMKHGFGMNKILGTIHIYPTLAEANKFAAGQWKRNQTTESALAWGERINRWRR
jgi:pyruvate/2-oxoglutarate dehydrogenase complex dihydrolipoamide dehydrogenase (E3) component